MDGKSVAATRWLLINMTRAEAVTAPLMSPLESSSWMGFFCSCATRRDHLDRVPAYEPVEKGHERLVEVPQSHRNWSKTWYVAMSEFRRNARARPEFSNSVYSNHPLALMLPLNGKEQGQSERWEQVGVRFFSYLGYT